MCQSSCPFFLKEDSSATSLGFRNDHDSDDTPNSTHTFLLLVLLLVLYLQSSSKVLSKAVMTVCTPDCRISEWIECEKLEVQSMYKSFKRSISKEDHEA